MSSGARRSIAGFLLKSVLAAILTLAPFAVFLVAISSDASSSEFAVDEPEVFVEPVRATFDKAVSVTVSIDLEPGPAVVAPAWQGTITNVFAGRGALAHLAPVVEIDGVTRMLVATPRPFYRSLQRRSEGDDVLDLQKLLVEMGLLADGDVNGIYGPRTEAAVGAFQDQIGATKNGNFDPGLLVWAPPATLPLAVDSLAIAVGQPAPSQGEEILRGAPVVASVSIETNDNQQGLFDPQGSSWVLEVVDGPLLTFADGEFNQGELLTLVEQPNDNKLAEIVGLMRRQESMAVDRLPATSVFSSGNALCAIVKDDSGSPSALEVNVVKSDFGTVDVDALPTESVVLANPSLDAQRKAKCASSS